MVWVVPVIVLIAFTAVVGCGGSSGETTATNASTSSSPAPTTGASQQANSNGASGRRAAAGASSEGTSGGASQKAAQPASPSPRQCVAAWNRAGPAPSLKNVLLPAARASGPFRALVGVAAGRCGIVVHAAGVEGTEAITYEVLQRPDGAFVQGQVPKPPPSAPQATLERDGSLKLTP
jgi:hypothetical protein